MPEVMVDHHSRRSHDFRHMRESPPLASMTGMHDLLLVPHIAAGVIALAAMLVPLVARKGSRLHRRGGWVFVIAMSCVSLTAFALAIWRFMMFDAAHPN